MKILVIDNYDSFTFNLVQQLGKFSCKVIVKRNDAVSVSDIIKIKPDKILISPGPKRPEVAAISLEVIRNDLKMGPFMIAILYAIREELTFTNKLSLNDFKKMQDKATEEIKIEADKMMSNLKEMVQEFEKESLEN